MNRERFLGHADGDRVVATGWALYGLLKKLIKIAKL
jgi:hypothetical protein